MSKQRQTITGELRKWHHDLNSKGEKCVIGRMYHDTSDIWDDGDEAILFYKDWYESANFYVAVMPWGLIKCPKDEEQKNESKTVNGGSEGLG